jgi:peptide/nickel transport system substrate-binding protein
MLPLRRGLAALLVLIAAAVAAPGQAQTLTVGLALETSSIDPHYQVYPGNLQVSHQIFEQLVRQDERQRLVPGLALSWQPVGDTLWEFKLRQGVRFHDGSPFTAADVAFSLDRAPQVPNAPSSFGIYTNQIREVIVVDPYTVRIRTDRPYPLMPNDLSAIDIVSHRAAAGASTDDFNSGKAAIGTGPFRFVEWVRGDRLVLARNDTYWGDKPAWERVVLRPITQDSARVAALLAGDVDAINQVPPSSVAGLRKRADLALVHTTSNRVIFLFPDSYRESTPYAVDASGKPLAANPFRDRRVRLAMSKAIDRKAIAEQVMEGSGVPAGQLLPEGYFGISAKLQPEPFDLDGARRLLAEAGYPNGFALTLLASTDRIINASQMALALAQMLTRAGIRTEVELVPGAIVFARRKTYDFSIYLFPWGSETGEPSSALRGLLATSDRERGWGFANGGRYSSPVLDSSLQRALGTVDDAKRADLLAQATEAGIGDLGLIPIHFEVFTWGLRKGLTMAPRAEGYTFPAAIRPAATQ